MFASDFGYADSTLSAIYAVVRKAYTKTIYVDRAFQKKTNELVQKYVDTTNIEHVTEFVEINSETIELIGKSKAGDGTKIINLVKSIEKKAEEESDDPFLIAMSERAKAVLENFEDRQVETAEALEELCQGGREGLALQLMKAGDVRVFPQ